MSERLSNDVFISYRRDVSQYMAMALWQNLTERGIDAFFDIESIPSGKFASVILRQIAARPYMLLVLAPGTLNRCVNEDDWLRREIEEAISLGRTLVPVHTPEFDREKIRANIEKHVKKFALTHPVMIDNDFSYWRAMKNRYWPAYYLIDKQGRVQAVFVGETHKGSAQAEKIEAVVKRLIKG